MLKNIFSKFFVWTVLFSCSAIVASDELYQAVSSGNLSHAQALIQQNPKTVEKVYHCRMSLLHVAAESGQLCMVPFLIDAGVSVNTQDSRGLTALCLAVLYRRPEVVQILLEDYNADVNRGNPLKEAVAQYVFYKNQVAKRIVYNLVNHGADLDKAIGRFGQTPLSRAVMCADTELVAFLLQKGARADMSIGGWGTYLHMPAALAEPQMMGLLLAFGVERDARDHGLETPLHVAAKSGHLPAVILLIMLGSEVDVAAQSGATPLMYAAEKGHDKVVEELLACHANVNGYDDYGNSVLSSTLQSYDASRNGEYQRTVAALINSEVQLEELSITSQNLHMAIALKSLPIVRYVIKNQIVLSAAEKAELLAVFPKYDWRQEQFRQLLKEWRKKLKS